MSIGNWLIMRTLRPASGLGNAVNNDLSGWIRVLPAGPFSASRRFPFVLNAGFIDSASAQKRSGRSLFSLILMPEKESTVLMEGMAATSIAAMIGTFTDRLPELLVHQADLGYEMPDGDADGGCGRESSCRCRTRR